jgi:hypothetical protein
VANKPIKSIFHLCRNKEPTKIGECLLSFGAEYFLFQVAVKNMKINPLNAELNPICHLLALLGAHHILHISRIRVKI